MRLLVDSTFAMSASGPQPGGHHIDRYASSAISDPDLVVHAWRQGYDAIVFLGSDALADPAVAEASRQHGVLVAASSSADPDEAELALKANLKALASRIGSTAPVILRKSSVIVSERPG